MRAKIASLLFRVPLLLVGIVPAGAQAFELMTTSSDKELHWVSAEMPVPFFIESGPSDVTDGSDTAALVASFAEWEKPKCSYLRFERVAEAKDTGGQACGGQRNTVAWVERGWPAELGRSVVAITMTCFEPGGGILGSRIIFNGQDHDWATDGRSSAIDVRNVATHEIGHFIGIGHSDVSGSTMWPTTSNGDIGQRDLHSDDLEAVCYVYPRPQPWSPGNGGGMLEGARETAERLGVDRVSGCEADAASGLGGVAAILVVLGLIRAGRRRRTPA